jgi:hypothetical protein
LGFEISSDEGQQLLCSYKASGVRCPGRDKLHSKLLLKIKLQKPGRNQTKMKKVKWPALPGRLLKKYSNPKGFYLPGDMYNC